MKTEFKKAGDTMIVSMEGRLDFETAGPLREDLGKLVKQAKTDTVPRKIIVNCENLEFVGSSGISSFVQTLKEFNTIAPIRPRYANVK
jgi:anti-anti-sigma factor